MIADGRRDLCRIFLGFVVDPRGIVSTLAKGKCGFLVRISQLSETLNPLILPRSGSIQVSFQNFFEFR